MGRCCVEGRDDLTRPAGLAVGCRFPQAAITAGPTLATVCDPPAQGPGGRRVSASRQLTFEIGRSSSGRGELAEDRVGARAEIMAGDLDLGPAIGGQATSTSEEASCAGYVALAMP